MTERLNNNKDLTVLISTKVKMLVTQSCPTLCDLMDCSLPGFSVHGISQARILKCLGQEDPLEKEMATHSQEIATHSTVLAWRISWTEEPCGLQSVE